MSKTLLVSSDVPKYIREIVKRLRPSNSYSKDDELGYTFNLYTLHKIGYEDQLKSNCEKLIAWCKRYHADAYIVSEHFWWTDVPAGSGEVGSKYHRRKAYEQGFRNHIKVVITDPVALRFERDNFYRMDTLFRED